MYLFPLDISNKAALGPQEPLAAARALTLASGTDQRDTALGELGLESGTVVVLVGDDHLTVLGGLVHSGQYREQGLALLRDRKSVV